MNSRDKIPEDELRHYFAHEEPKTAEVDEELVEMSFGEYLVDQLAITRQQLFSALQLQDKNPGVRLGECIAALGILPYPDVEERIRDWKSIQVVEL